MYSLYYFSKNFSSQFFNTFCRQYTILFLSTQIGEEPLKKTKGKGIDTFTDCEEVNSNKNLLALSSSIGIVPCPGVTIILLFSINKDILPVGLVAIAFMSLGMALTISFAAIATITARKYTINLVQNKPKIYDIAEFIIQVLGSILMVVLGIMLLLYNV